MRKRKILVFSNLQNSVTRMLQQRKKVIFSPLENRKNKKEKQNMGTQQQSISSRKKWDIQRGKTAPRKWKLPENRSKSRKWGLPDPTAVFMATFQENAKVEHDHQTPENSEPVKRREIRPNEPTAFCHNCQEMTPMV